MAERWETVPSKVSKKSQKSGSNGTTIKKSELQAPKAPIFGEKSQYEALIPKEKKPPAKETPTPVSKQKSSIPRPQKKDNSKKPKTLNVEAAVASIGSNQFEETYTRSQELFKDAPLVWLRELTGQLNALLDTVSQTDFIFADSSQDFPSSLLKPDIKKVFNKSINECTGEVLELFLNQLIQSTMGEMSKGHSVYGYQMVVQLLAKNRPELFPLKAEKYVTILGNNKNVPSKCLVVMWMLGQGGVYSFKAGLKVWVSLMLQVIGIKSLAPYAVSYLALLLQKAGSSIDQGYNIIEMKDYFLLFDGIFMMDKNVQVASQKKLREFYPILKKLAFGKNPKDRMHSFFPSFLARLSMEKGTPDMHRELLESIIFCLASDKRCFTIWKQNLYLQHLPQSSIVLKHLTSDWSSLSLTLNSALVTETVREFSAINSKLNKSTPGLQSCMAACAKFEEISVRASESSRSTFKFVVGLCLLMFFVLIAIDVGSSGGWRESRIGRLLKDTGADVVLTSVFRQASSFFYKASAFLFSNVPVWLEAVIVVCEPLLDLVWRYTVATVTFLISVSAPLRAFIAESVPYCIDWVIMHPAWEVLYNMMVTVQSTLQPLFDSLFFYLSPVIDRLKAVFL
ncbi:transmembrane protein 214-B-like [Watersipora subatra]|uniref:transmembrane protein 214-B-like n=1 Tax=Watersipora subatra TaxID=2589382 RepID=UPI00355C7C54